MSQTFRCKDATCGLDVTYTPEQVPGGIGFNVRKVEKKEAFVVYLTCDNDHTYRYTVDPDTLSENQSG